MKNLNYLLLTAVFFLGLTSCQQNESILETEVTQETVDVNLKINNRSVLTTNSFASYCDEELADGGVNNTIAVTNTDLRISELFQLEELELNLGEFFLYALTIESIVTEEPTSVHIMVAYLDLEGTGPTYAMTDLLNLDESTLEFTAASQSIVAGTFSGTLYFVDDINDPDFDFMISGDEETADFEISFSTDQIDICPE